MGFVYLINSGTTDRYKIGVSKKPPVRKKELQTGNPMKLSLVDYYESDIYKKIEIILHRTLCHKKFIEEDFEMLGGEWFIFNNDDVIGFKEKCKKIEKSIKHLEKYSTFDVTKML